MTKDDPTIKAIRDARHRISEMAVYIVHASLLLIFFGTIVDGIWGWRGELNLNEGQSSNIVELRDSKTRTLPFAIRCDSAGQEQPGRAAGECQFERLELDPPQPGRKACQSH